MDKPYKRTETVEYTETVYFNDLGEEVARVRIHDDTITDYTENLDLTDDELDTYFPTMED